MTLIGLLRGINVGGKNLLPMKSLVAVLEELGAGKVRTYIQSGNAVFDIQKTDCARLSKKISAAIGAAHGFEPSILLLTVDRFSRAMRANPFAESTNTPQSVHLGFLASPAPKAKLEEMSKLRLPSEQFKLIKDVFYLYAPDGIGRSKLAANAERLIGVPMTMRNWKTVSKISELALSDPPSQGVRH